MLWRSRRALWLQEEPLLEARLDESRRPEVGHVSRGEAEEEAEGGTLPQRELKAASLVLDAERPGLEGDEEGDGGAARVSKQEQLRSAQQRKARLRAPPLRRKLLRRHPSVQPRGWRHVEVVPPQQASTRRLSDRRQERAHQKDDGGGVGGRVRGEGQLRPRKAQPHRRTAPLIAGPCGAQRGRRPRLCETAIAPPLDARERGIAAGQARLERHLQDAVLGRAE
mmetsp:Transcript_8874/g.28016  ORF Transcript_8874/g.28016 Transcript_8874/m.28016 type:complete len:224 (+) Transcript_8874:2190-2861(+)